MTARSTDAAGGSVRLGLRENLGQFSLLVLINAFVGGMVGIERTLVPLVGAQEFGIGSEVVVFSFIIAFGLIKALINLASGLLADRFTRKMVLVAGWIVGLPVPFMLAWGPSWTWIIAANVLLGISQGLAWSMTVNMKIDLVGPAQRGLAMGLNEAAGYGALGATALLTGYLAASYGLRPAPFYIGIVYSVLGLALSVFLVHDTRGHAQLEAANHGAFRQEPIPSIAHVFAETSWRNRTLFSVSQAGLVNNLNDGMSWGVFPLLFVANGLSLEKVGLIKAIYPIVWGAGQIFTGLLADRVGRKPLIVWGMIIQAAGHAVIGLGLAAPFLAGLVGSALLGAGTAMVYPALLAAVGDVAHPTWRATSVGVYRFWRDLGYAVGALMAGIVAVMLGLVWAVHVAGMLTFLSGLVAWAGMSETLPTLAPVAPVAPKRVDASLPSMTTEPLPLLQHPLESPSAFTPERLMAAVRSERGLTHVVVPPLCVLDFDGDLSDHLAATGMSSPWSSWACFHTSMRATTMEGITCGIVPRTIGGPYAVLVSEQLWAAGAKLIVGITSAGRVSASLPLPSIVIVDEAVRDEGTSLHYLAPGASIAAPTTDILDPLVKELSTVSSAVRRGRVWTTDAPYRETAEQLRLWADRNVLAVEMQAASLFAFAHARGAQVGLVALVSNAVDEVSDDFNTGGNDDRVRVLRAVARAARTFVPSTADAQ